MEEKLYKLYQGEPVSFTWDELEDLPHDVFDDESAELIIEAHQGRRGLVLHLTEDEAEMLGGKLNFKKIGSKIKSGLKKANNVTRDLGISNKSITRNIRDIEDKYQVSRKVGNAIKNYDREQGISKNLKSMNINDIRNGKIEDFVQDQYNQGKYNLNNMSLGELADQADRYTRDIPDMEGGKIKWKKIGSKVAKVGMKVMNTQNKIANKIANNLPLDAMGPVGELVQLGMTAQNKGVAFANDLYDNRKAPGGFKGQLKRAAIQTAKREGREILRNQLNSAKDSALNYSLGAPSGGSFKGNGMHGSAGGSFRGNESSGGSFKGNGMSKPKKKYKNSSSASTKKPAYRVGRVANTTSQENSVFLGSNYVSPDNKVDLEVAQPDNPAFYTFRTPNTRPNYYRNSR